MPCRAICDSDGLTAAPGLGDWFEPYSVALGVGNRATNVATDRLLAVPELDRFGPFQSDAVGVPTDNPGPVTSVRGADGLSRYAIPFRVIPERGQIPENVPHSSNKEPWDVLHEHISGS
jgi:hypothetical protein